MVSDGIIANMRIYFSGIGGVGIGPLAEIALDAGYSVYGSDREPSVMTRSLQDRGVNISFDQSGDFLQTEHKKSPLTGLCTHQRYQIITQN